MKQVFCLAAAAAAAFIAGGAQAQQMANPATPWSAEIGYSWLTVRESTTGFRASPQAIRGIVGYAFHPNFAVEGLVAAGTRSDSDLGVDVKVRDAFAVFVKPKYNFDNVEVFARLGWARTSVRLSALGGSVSDSDDDFAWGAGINYNFNPRMYAGIDYLRLHNRDSARIDGVTLNVGWRF